MMGRKSFVRINSLLWADILVAFALFEMQNYLTDVWKLNLTQAAGILNFWNGIYRILPVFFLYLVDSFLGNFKLLVFTSIAYATGITLVAMSTPPILANSTHTCKEYEPQCISPTQKILLYAGLSLIAVGVAGNLVSHKPFLNEQKDEAFYDFYRVIRYQELRLISMLVATLAGALGLPYIKPWTLRFWIPAGCTAFSTCFFLTGLCIKPYLKQLPEGSPISNMCRVFVAAALNMFQQYPIDYQRYHGIEERRFSKTRCLRGLHKAAIKPADYNDREISRWKLCSVAEVEDAKIAVRMVPMWLTFIMWGVVASAGDTYFVAQAGKLNRSIGKLKLPIQVLLLTRKWAIGSLDQDLSVGFRSRWSSQIGRPRAKVPFWIKKWIKYDGAPAIGIGMGMICAILCCISAAGVEKMRLSAVGKHGLLDKPDEDVPLSMYWLIFQFFLLGCLDSFMENCTIAHYRDQDPKSMKRYLKNFIQGVSGLGYMSSALFVYIVGRISETGGRRNWFQETLNMSRLDRYYWVLAALSSVNLVFFVFVSSRYRYRQPGGRGLDDIVEDGGYTDGYDELSGACFGCCR